MVVVVAADISKWDRVRIRISEQANHLTIGFAREKRLGEKPIHGAVPLKVSTTSKFEDDLRHKPRQILNRFAASVLAGTAVCCYGDDSR